MRGIGVTSTRRENATRFAERRLIGVAVGVEGASSPLSCRSGGSCGVNSGAAITDRSTVLGDRSASSSGAGVLSFSSSILALSFTSGDSGTSIALSSCFFDPFADSFCCSNALAADAGVAIVFRSFLQLEAGVFFSTLSCAFAERAVNLGQTELASSSTGEAFGVNDAVCFRIPDLATGLGFFSVTEVLVFDAGVSPVSFIFTGSGGSRDLDGTIRGIRESRRIGSADREKSLPIRDFGLRFLLVRDRPASTGSFTGGTASGVDGFSAAATKLGINGVLGVFGFSSGSSNRK